MKNEDLQPSTSCESPKSKDDGGRGQVGVIILKLRCPFASPLSLTPSRSFPGADHLRREGASATVEAREEVRVCPDQGDWRVVAGGPCDAELPHLVGAAE